MELITTDEMGEILVYECPECGHQLETRVENEEADLDDALLPGGADLGADEDEAEGEQLEPDQEE